MVDQTVTVIREEIYKTRQTMASISKRIKENDKITPRNKELILRFVEDSKAKSITDSRRCLYLNYMERIAKLTTTDFDKMKREDVKNLVAKLEAKKYSDWTKETSKSILKIFIKWLNRWEKGDSVPETISWIECRTPPNGLTAEELLTQEEITKLIQACHNTMHKAMISTLYEGALRPGELLSMRISDVYFDQNRAKINVYGKMGRKEGTRSVFLYNSYDLLERWIGEHPFKDDKSSPLWIVTQQRENFGKPLRLDILRTLLQKATKRAAKREDDPVKRQRFLTLRIYPYIFRHSRARCLHISYGESVAKKILGHSPDSRMSRVYQHLNQEDVMDAMDQQHGIRTKKKTQQTTICTRCKHSAPYGAEICSKCGKPLTLSGSLNIESMKEEVADLVTQPQLVELLRTLTENPQLITAIQTFARNKPQLKVE